MPTNMSFLTYAKVDSRCLPESQNLLSLPACLVFHSLPAGKGKVRPQTPVHAESELNMNICRWMERQHKDIKINFINTHSLSWVSWGSLRASRGLWKYCMKQLETEKNHNDLFKWVRQVISLTLQSKEQHWRKDL